MKSPGTQRMNVKEERMSRIWSTAVIVGLFAITMVVATAIVAQDPKKKPEVIQYVDTDTGRWMVHDENRPAPPVITAGICSSQAAPVPAPSDATVLFDGKDLANWVNAKGEPTKWIIRDGYMESVKGAGGVSSRQQFGSCQLHVEFATPSVVTGSGQGRGNSGVFLQGMYEIQVLDSYENKTYPDGQCGALYGRAVPLVNACCKPGQWQMYDVIYRRPLFEPSGKVIRKAMFTVFHNGVLIQDHVELTGGTGWISAHAITEYVPHGDKGPIMLQDHSNPVRFRNIWIRELKD
jgi:hypothetical protein